jgi:hypothetical protein
LKATAQMSDGTSRDVTTSASWESSNPTLATVSGAGLVSVLGTGDLDVRATYQSVTGTLHLSVTKRPVVSGIVMEAPPNAKPIAGARVQIVGGDHVFTDAQGAFSVAAAGFGPMILVVSKDGYQLFSNEYVLDRDLRLDITLYPVPSTMSSGRADDPP